MRPSASRASTFTLSAARPRTNERRSRTIDRARSAWSTHERQRLEGRAPLRSSSMRLSAKSRTAVSGLLSSCATPETNCPTAASFSDCRSALSAARSGVRSSIDDS